MHTATCFLHPILHAVYPQKLPVWNKPDISAFVDGPLGSLPKAAPSIVNAKELGLKMA